MLGDENTSINSQSENPILKKIFRKIRANKTIAVTMGCFSGLMIGFIVGAIIALTLFFIILIFVKVSITEFLFVDTLADISWFVLAGAIIGGVLGFVSGGAYTIGKIRNTTEINDEERGRLIQSNIIETENLRFIRKNQLAYDPNDENQLGRGDFGTVYRGTYNGQMVAIKVLNPIYQYKAMLETFYSEARILAQYRSDHIVSLHGVCFEPNHYALVLEYMPRGSLSKVLSQSELELEWQIRYRIALDVGKGVDWLHERNVIHGDLKDNNILIDNKFCAKIADFGMAKVRERSMDGTVDGDSAGGRAIRWLAPELIFGTATKSSKTTDVYSYGRILQDLATREECPFLKSTPEPHIFQMRLGNDTLNSLDNELPDETPTRLAYSISWCCQHQSANRPRMAQVVEELEREYTALYS